MNLRFTLFSLILCLSLPNFAAGPVAVSAEEAFIDAAPVYRMALTLASCERRPRANFWDDYDPCMRITFEYGPEPGVTTGTLVTEFCRDSYTTYDDGTLMVWTVDPYASPSGFGTSYGPGCQGGGDPIGTDHLDGVFIQNQSFEPLYINNITVAWSCDGFNSPFPNCSDDYSLLQVRLRVDEDGNCGHSQCEQCTNIHRYGNKCDPSGEVSFEPLDKYDGTLYLDHNILIEEEL